MPELPEVETVCRGLAPVITGQVITKLAQMRPDIRIPLPDHFAERVEGRRVHLVRRRAKYILVELDDGQILVIHLGMSGAIRITEGAYGDNVAAGKHEHVILYTGSGARVAYHDPRRFGLMTLIDPGGEAAHPLFREIGPEPLGNSFNGEVLAEALKGRKSPIKSALLDQQVVAGLGNIYVCEALYRARLSPRRTAYTVAGARAERLAGIIREVLNEAILAGGSTLKDYARVDGELGYFQHQFSVYGREGEACKTAGCSDTVRRLVQSGRSTFYCPTCQR
jgi:formamidopyrimidine-DNA glycosylase